MSRWGRFQDADESAHYEFICRRAGIRMVYCAEPFVADTTPLGNVLKSLKRAMAGEFSRELGVKVSAGKARIGKMGFRIGGPAGYGLRRQLLAGGVAPGALLTTGQRKSIQTDRVKLVPGPAEEIALIQRIYRDYVHLRKSERDIARDLNEEGLTYLGRPWSRNLVRTILTNEKYIGNNVVGRVSARLYTRQVSNPPEKWTRCEGAFPSIVPRHLFDAAQQVRRFNEKVFRSREDLLRALRIVLKREGRLSAHIIGSAPELPSANTVALRFGSLGQAYESIGYVPAARYRHHALDRGLRPRVALLAEQLCEQLKAQGLPARAKGARVFAVGDHLKIDVLICRNQRRHEHERGWRIRYQRNADADFILACRLREGELTELDYLLVHKGDLARLPEFLRSSHQQLLGAYSFTSVGAIARKIARSWR